MPTEIKSPRKLIETALPLDAINAAAAREKSIRHGHLSNLHRWWARRPLAAARATLFAQLVNDPGYERHLGRGLNKEKAAIERERLFKIIEDLVKWENTNNSEVLNAAKAEIWKSWRETCILNKNHPQAAELFNPDKLPAFHDPFAGGGSIPLEAQRLGLEAWASDLNPVAVTINKAMIEIPPKFAGRAPIGPAVRGGKTERLPEQWTGASGLAEDVRRYGAWMRAEAQKRIGHLYPPVEITPEMVAERPDLEQYKGQKLTVIAWLWARTVKSPNPAFSHVDVPLAASFVLSSKKGKEAYVQPVVEGDRYRFTVKVGTPPEGATLGTSAGKRAAFKCLLSSSPITYDYIRGEGKAGRIKQRLMAIVAEGSRGRVYLSPDDLHETIALQAQPAWIPQLRLPNNPRDFKTPLYGLDTYGSLFTPRQLVALTTFSDLVGEAIAKCRADAVKAGLPDDNKGVDNGGLGAQAYAEAVGVYLALVLSKTADSINALCPWEPNAQCPRQLFGRQAIPMVWDFAEANILSSSSGSFIINIDGSLAAFKSLPNLSDKGTVSQKNAINQYLSKNRIVSTDPPYYDNVGYADISDFFYIWLKHSLRLTKYDFFATLESPKKEELVATPYRHGSSEKAEKFFLNGMREALHNISIQSHPVFPITIYYAFKQSETKSSDETFNTGWEVFLDAILQSGFTIVGTWPMRTEMTAALKTKTNALASSIVLVCRKRDPNAPTISRREFTRELNAVLPEALLDMTRGGVNSPVAPVDLSQAIIGPGMAVFSKYSAVLEADGKPMSVRTALSLINRFLAEDDFDADTQFCLAWFGGRGWDNGPYGEADVLARAKGTSVGGLAEAGVVESGGGNVRLLRWAQMPADWNPAKDTRLPVWEGLHQLIRALNQQGESEAGKLLAHMLHKTEAIRSLAYRLYTLCERKGWAEDARAYNELITSWPAIEQTMNTQPAPTAPKQIRFDI